MCFVIYVSEEHSKAGSEIKKWLQRKADIMNSLLVIPHFEIKIRMTVTHKQMQKKILTPACSRAVCITLQRGFTPQHKTTLVRVT